MKLLVKFFVCFFIFAISFNIIIAQQVDSRHVLWTTGLMVIGNNTKDIPVQIVNLDGLRGFVIADDVFIYGSAANLLSGLGTIKEIKLAHWDSDDNIVYSKINYIPRIDGQYISIDLVTIRHNILSGYNADHVMTIKILYKDLL